LSADCFQRIIALLDAAGTKYSVHEHVPVITIEDARECVPHLAENVLKTVVFRVGGADWILAVTLGDQRIHYRKLADTVGCNRRDLRLVPAEVVAEALGFEVGGVGPFPIEDRMRIFFEATIPDLPQVVCGSGLRDRSIELSLADLIKVSGGERKHLVR
jgi:Cys-tRNA(Pro)/Cys-tRNA(Cys) deacylase